MFLVARECMNLRKVHLIMGAIMVDSRALSILHKRKGKVWKMHFCQYCNCHTLFWVFYAGGVVL